MDRLERATLAGGCFWCTEAVFSRLKGVYEVISGYAGGDVENPTYEQVCSGRTKHVEAIQLRFDAEEITFAELLEVFWRTHNPTTLNRQGPDRGNQYRSVIFYHDEQQRQVAEDSKKKAEMLRIWPDPIVTEIVPFTNFYPAEGYHRDYYRFNRNQPYCVMVIDPKMESLRKHFAYMLKE